MDNKYIKINEADNVAVALDELKAGEVHGYITLSEDIPAGHKFAVNEIPAGGQVIKYGNPIGSAAADIHAGEHVHTHNLVTNLAGCPEYTYEHTPAKQLSVTPRKVKVYRRSGGDVGIRNELWIIPTVGCVNGQVKLILETFKSRYGVKGFDGAYAFTHPNGCSKLGDDGRTLQILQKLIRHPNAGGILVVGLGCDGDDMVARETFGAVDENRIKFLNCQEVDDEIEAGVQMLHQIAEIIKKDSREEQDISCLKVGLKCGASDGLSYITANPLVGRFSDYLVAAGGTVLLSEVYESFGAEQLLINRAKDEEVFEKTVKLINNSKEYFRLNGQNVYINPSQEEKAGGITTIEEKALGFTQKAGSGEIQDIVFDGGFVTQPGLNLLSGPGNDMGAVTDLAAAGCHIVLFTTGMGTPFGGSVPTVKISSNSTLASKKSNWIDFDAGAVLEDGFDKQLEKLADLVAAIASGKLAKNEINNTRELAIYKTGMSL